MAILQYILILQYTGTLLLTFGGERGAGGESCLCGNLVVERREVETLLN